MKLSIYRDRYFFENYPENDINAQKYYSKNIKVLNEECYLYKGKFWVYIFNAQDKHHTSRFFTTDDVTFPKKISKLSIHQRNIQKHDSGLPRLKPVINEIKNLPKNLKVITFEGFLGDWTLQPLVLPKTLVSLAFKFSTNPLQGADLTHLTKLEVFYAHNSSTQVMPKFSSSIVCIYASNNRPLSGKKLINFKLSNYPNLKYIDVRGSIYPKYIPKEWKLAKKEGKITILW